MNLFRKNILSLFLLLAFLHSDVRAQTIQKLKINELAEIISNSDSVLVINFWATFCKPCIEEIPDLIKYTKKYKKEKALLYLISLDLEDYYPQKIERFVSQKKYSANIAWLNESNADYFCPMIDTTWSGAIPATLIVNNKKGHKKFYEKQLNASEVEAAIKEAL